MMTVDSVIAPELLTAEIAAIEDLLVHYEDWRALGQLESRERQGDLPASVSTSAIKGMLYEKLASNPLFLRRQALLKELERLTELAKQAANELRLRAMNAGEGDDGDDFTRIRGVDARLERRLNALNVRAYEQIAGWTEADVHYVASTLGLGDLIVSQMWIEQAGLLAAARWRHAGAATEDRRATSPAAITATGSKQTVETNVVEPKFSETLKVESPGLEKSDGAKLGVAPVEPVKPSVRQPAAVPPAAKAPVSSAPPLPAVPPVTVPQPLAASVPAVIGKPQSDAQTVPLSAPQPAAHNTPQAQSKLGVDARDKAKVAPAAGAGTPSGVEPASPANKVLEPAATPASPAPSVPAGFPHTKTEASATAAHAPVKPLPAELDVKVATPSSPAGSDKVAASAANGSPTASPPPAAAPEIDYGALVPAHPLAARRYGGTVLEPLDPGVLNGAPPPPKPRPAAAYAQPAGAPKAADIEPVAPPRSEKSAAEILDQSLPPLQLKPSLKAAERTAPVVPPPPLPANGSSAMPAQVPPPAPAGQPAQKVAASVQSPAKSATADKADREPSPTSHSKTDLKPDTKPTGAPPAVVAAPVIPPRAAPVEKVPAAVSARQSEDFLLAAAAARSSPGSGPVPGSAAQPPPLPPSVSSSHPSASAFAVPPLGRPPFVPPPVTAEPAGTSSTARVEPSAYQASPQASLAVQGRLAAVPETSKAAVFEETGARGSSEARVTIRRAEEAMANAVLRVPGGTDVQLGRRREIENFDGKAYAAYHSEVEEASVQIVRRPAQPAASAPTALQAATQAAAQSAIQSAARASGKAAGQGASAPPVSAAVANGRGPGASTPVGPQAAPPVGPAPSKSNDPFDAKPDTKQAIKPGAGMGRFLKALTGQ